MLVPVGQHIVELLPHPDGGGPLRMVRFRRNAGHAVTVVALGDERLLLMRYRPYPLAARIRDRTGDLLRRLIEPAEASEDIRHDLTVARVLRTDGHEPLHGQLPEPGSAFETALQHPPIVRRNRIRQGVDDVVLVPCAVQEREGRAPRLAPELLQIGAASVRAELAEDLFVLV